MPRLLCLWSPGASIQLLSKNSAARFRISGEKSPNASSTISCACGIGDGFFGLKQRRVTVIMGQRLYAQDLALQMVVAGDKRIIADNGVTTRLTVASSSSFA